jgi:hypothetical protein
MHFLGFSQTFPVGSVGFLGFSIVFRRKGLYIPASTPFKGS